MSCALVQVQTRCPTHQQIPDHAVAYHLDAARSSAFVVVQIAPRKFGIRAGVIGKTPAGGE
jgi:hypothetical protein